MKCLVAWLSGSLAVGTIAVNGQTASSFVNFETAPVHPVALSPNASALAVCNLPDGRAELFDVSGDLPRPMGGVPVGVDPVSLRFRTTNELWVVNHISSSISVVDMARRHVVATLDTLSGPADVVFAGSPPRAFVSCAKVNTIQIFNPITRQCVTNLTIDAERPKAMAVSPDGSKVYVAIFESGNGSTILAGRSFLEDPRGPYGGQYPVPNSGLTLNPPLYINTNREPANYYDDFGPVSLIVKKDSSGRWLDDNNGDWTQFISGTNSAPRPQGWDMPDRDLAVIDTASLNVIYVAQLMNICMDVAVNPASGRIAVVGTDAQNEIRFEPNLRGTFLRVNLAMVEPSALTRVVRDLNGHLDYSSQSVPVSMRDQSIGDPRGIVWNAAGTRAYVTGMGSRNLVAIDADGNRVTAQPVELGEGPTGLALDETRQRLYVLNRFSSTLATLDLATLTLLTNVPLFDPTPPAIRTGRKHLYDTRRNSGLGHVSCGSCHVDGRFDRLAWDLGNPSADTALTGFHPMKGPLVTQTLQDIIGTPILHWRGDRGSLEDFNVTFTDLLAADRRLTTNEMQEFKEFLDTIHFPPNRFRNFDNTLPTNVPLPGFSGFDELGGSGAAPLPDGDAVRGKSIFNRDCHRCHQFQTGFGNGGDDLLINRESRPLKVAQLRSLPDKLGMSLSGMSSRAGFGLRFDGRDDSLARFLVDIDIRPDSDRELADLTAFLLSFSGTGLDPLSELLGSVAKDAVAAVGRQLTLTEPTNNALFVAMVALADSPTSRVDLIARGVEQGLNRGWFYDCATGLFQSDRNHEDITPAALLGLAAPDKELTFTVVPQGSGKRLGIDRDEDGYFDLTETETGFDPADPSSHGSNAPPHLTPVRSHNGFVGFNVHPGMSVSTTFSATDADAPSQTLTFSLVRGASLGATINPTNGLFTWRPAAEHANRTHRFGVQVTDDGSPGLSDTMAIEIAVFELRIVDIVPAHPIGATLVTFLSVPQRQYQLQFKDRIDAPWVGGFQFDSFGWEFQLTDYQFRDSPVRFYRVKAFE